MTSLKEFIHDIPDFPRPGIIFKDITPLLDNPKAVEKALRQFTEIAQSRNVTKVAGIESRGFLFGILLAQSLNVGFIPLRKPGKLPSDVFSRNYELEYGSAGLELRKDALSKNDRVLLHDDLLATGGTATAARDLIKDCGAEIVLANFIVELTFLNGRKRLNNIDIHSLIQY